MKRVGIVADNYKLDKFRKDLTKAGFPNFKIIPFTPDTSAISVTVDDDKVKEVKNICELIELHFKRSN